MTKNHHRIQSSPPLLGQRRPTRRYTAAAAAATAAAVDAVACNIYVSAGGNRDLHGPILTQLLQTAQRQCYNNIAASSSSGNDNNKAAATVVTVVHAYSDPVYNRSSFHLAGFPPEAVGNVASNLACSAIEQLRRAIVRSEDEEDSCEKEVAAVTHPYIGYVDHVAVMPLMRMRRDNEEEGTHSTTTAVASAATTVQRLGEDLSEQLGVKIFLYGAAHPENLPLATVRRQQTNFFRSGGLSTPSSSSPNNKKHDSGSVIEAATVGTPDDVVENYNILLNTDCPRHVAVQLSKRLRERDGSGLLGVETLTLPYSHNRYEVACNLLKPNTTCGATIEDVQAAVDEWEHEQGTTCVERAYRVGTTAEHCREALDRVQTSSEERRSHDNEIMRRLRKYLGYNDG